jgi:hypothetical protein
MDIKIRYKDSLSEEQMNKIYEGDNSRQSLYERRNELINEYKLVHSRLKIDNLFQINDSYINEVVKDINRIVKEIRLIDRLLSNYY